MRKTKCLWCLMMIMVLSLALSTGMVACSNAKPISLTAETSTLEVGEEIVIKVSGDDVDHLVWNSSDVAVASVEDGKVKALSIGKTTIKARRSSEKEDTEQAGSIVITVVNTGVAPQLSVVNEDWELFSGQNVDLGAKVTYGSSEVAGEFNYESSDTDVATVSVDGKITAVANGVATITVSAKYRGRTVTEQFEVTVYDYIIQLENSTVTLYTDSNQDSNTYPTSYTVEAGLYLLQGKVDATVSLQVKNDEDTDILSISGNTVSITGGISGDKKNVPLNVICSYDGKTYREQITIIVIKTQIEVQKAIFELSENKFEIELGKEVNAADVNVLLGDYEYEWAIDKVDGTKIAMQNVDNLLTASSVDMGDHVDLIIDTPVAKYTTTAVFYDYYILTSDDFHSFVLMGEKSEKATAYFALGSNIDADNQLINCLWLNTAFAGVLDGNGYTIKNISTKKGVFADMTTTAVVKNIGLDINVIGAESSTGYASHKLASGLFANGSGTFKDCHITIDITDGCLTDGATLIGGVCTFRDKGSYNTLGSFSGNVITVNFGSEVLSNITNCGAIVACAPVDGNSNWLGQFVNDNYVISNCGRYVRTADGYKNTCFTVMSEVTDAFVKLDGSYLLVKEGSPEMKNISSAYVKYLPPAPVTDLIIDSLDDLRTFISWGTDETLQTQHSAAKVVLGANIDAEGLLMNGLFKETGFNGIFDGQGYTISNLTTKGGLFYNIAANGVVKNLGLNNLKIVGYETSANAYSHKISAGIFTISSGLVTNCYFDIVMTADAQDSVIRGGITSGRGDDDGSHMGIVSHNYIKVTFEGTTATGNAGVITGCEGAGAWWNNAELGTNYLVSNHEYPVRSAGWGTGYGKAYASETDLKTAVSGTYVNLNGEYWVVNEGIPSLQSKTV